MVGETNVSESMPKLYFSGSCDIINSQAPPPINATKYDNIISHVSGPANHLSKVTQSKLYTRLDSLSLIQAYLTRRVNAGAPSSIHLAADRSLRPSSQSGRFI